MSVRKDNHKQIKLAIKWYGSSDVNLSVTLFIKNNARWWRKTKH